MFDTAIVMQAVKFGYKRYGPVGAVAAAAAIGTSYAVAKRVIPRYTSIDEQKVDEVYGGVSEAEEVFEVLGEEFYDRFENALDDSRSRID